MKELFGKVACLLVLTAAAASAVAADCRYREPREALLDAAGARLLVIEARAGSLHVQGVPGSDQVVAEGEACVDRKSDLEAIRLGARRRGDVLHLETEMPESAWGGGEEARLDLVVRVPGTLPLEIDDGSGEVQIRDVGPVRVDDGSGSLEVHRVAGSVEVEDGSGEIELEEIRDDAVIRDGSGSIDVDGVGGSVTVEEDGSGEIRIHGVGGDVVLREDGSGSIRVSDVGGDVLVGRDGSGSIRVRHVVGDFTVESDGSGGIDWEAVGGRVETPD